MARLALIGFSSDRHAPEKGGGAACMRTSRFHSALIGAGHTVEYISPATGSRSGAEVRNFLGERPDIKGIVAISMKPAIAAVRSRTELPLWIDLNGAHPAEMQLRSSIEPTRELLARTLHQEALLLRRGDRFSTVSAQQRLAVIGELMILGRLDGGDISYEMVSCIGNCAMDIGEYTHHRQEGTFSILSSGSFNLWFDAETLLKALETAMEKDSRIRFTCVGGPVPHSPYSYEQFLEKVNNSHFRKRMDIRGWVDKRELEEIYMRSDAAVYTDIPCYESELGARTRVLDWISRGIPVVCTRGAEISADIDRYGLGITVPQKNPQILADALIKLSGDSRTYERIVENQLSWCTGPGRISHMFNPLLKWAESPGKSPFRKRPVGRLPVSHPRSPSFLFWLTKEYLANQGIKGLSRRILKKFGM